MTRAANGRSSIHRRTDGQGWEGWLGLGLHPVTGKRWRKHVRGKTKTEVARKVEQQERRRDRGILAVDHATTLSSWLEAWLAGRVAAGLRQNSISAYRTDLKYVARSHVGRVRLRDLTPEHVERIPSHHRQPALEPYSKEEIATLLAAARSRRNGVRWGLALLGLRHGEVLALRWQDLDIDNGELTVRHTLTRMAWQHGVPHRGRRADLRREGGPLPARHGGGPLLGPPKSAAGRRTISLPAPVAAELREHRARQAAERLAATRWHDHGFVITNASGGPLDRTSDREDWHHLLATAGLRRLRIHNLRHSAATALLVLGEDSRVLMGIMGWTSMTLVQRYTHIVPSSAAASPNAKPHSGQNPLTRRRNCNSPQHGSQWPRVRSSCHPGDRACEGHRVIVGGHHAESAQRRHAG